MQKKHDIKRIMAFVGTAFKKALSYFLYGNVGKSFYRDCRQALENANFLMVRTMYSFAALMCCFLFIVASISRRVASLRYFYLGFTILFTALAALIFTSLRKNRRWLRVLYYFLAALIFGITIYVGTARNPHMPAIMFFVLLMILPLLYIEPPIYSVLMSFVACVVFCLFTIRLKASCPDIAEFDLLNTLCCFPLSVGLIFYNRNITLKNIRATMLFRTQSETDRLTAIANKASTENLCRLYLSRAGSLSPCAMLILDIDNFKNINDKLGHQQGDCFLQKVGEILRRTFRENDIVGRIGGDEFLVLMKDASDRAIIARKAGEIGAQIGSIFEELTTHYFTCSIGIALSFPAQPLSYETLFFQADRALYHVKQNQKNSFKFYSEVDYTLFADKPLLLVVDDAEVSRAILRSCFESEYSILEAANGQDALTCMRRYSSMLTAVLLDIEMPVMNGYEVLEAVRADPALRPIPILVITAHEKSESQALELGAVDLIVKPFDSATVKKRVKSARERTRSFYGNISSL